MFWTGIIISAILFGIGHLPLASQVWEMTAAVVARTVIQNSLGGITFGFIYWKKGLEFAIASHFFTDISLNIISAYFVD